MICTCCRKRLMSTNPLPSLKGCHPCVRAGRKGTGLSQVPVYPSLGGAQMTAQRRSRGGARGAFAAQGQIATDAFGLSRPLAHMASPAVFSRHACTSIGLGQLPPPCRIHRSWPYYPLASKNSTFKRIPLPFGMHRCDLRYRSQYGSPYLSTSAQVERSVDIFVNAIAAVAIAAAALRVRLR